MPTPRSTAGLRASRVSSTTSSPGGHLEAVEQVLGVERHGQLAALVAGVEGLVGLADVLGHGQQLEPVGAHHQPDRRRLPGQQPHPPHGVEQQLAAHRQAVGVVRGDQASGSSGTRPR